MKRVIGLLSIWILIKTAANRSQEGDGNIGKILIVDDDQQSRTILETFLEDEGYQTITVENGAQALEIIEEKEINLVILDVLMPGMDGFEVCEKIKFEMGYKQLPVIMVTSLEAREDRLKGLKAGADDFLTKPVDWAELIGRAKSMLRLKEAYDQVETQYQKLQYQLHLARGVQEVLTKAEIPQKLSGEIFYNPVEEIGGDIYDIIKLNENKFGLFLGDSSGHGVPAALVMVMVKLLFSEMDKFSLTPGTLFEILNEKIRHHFQEKLDDIYITGVYMVLDLEKGSLRWSNAGHPSPIIFKKGGEWSRPGGQNMPLGVMSEVKYDTYRHKWSPQAGVFVYTDGLIDYMDHHSSRLSEPQVDEILSKLQFYGSSSHSSFYKELTEDIKNNVDDDVCYCLLKRKK